MLNIHHSPPSADPRLMARMRREGATLGEIARAFRLDPALAARRIEFGQRLLAIDEVRREPALQA